MFGGKRLAIGVVGVVATLGLASCGEGVTEPLTLPEEQGPARAILSTTAVPVFQDGFENGVFAAAQNGISWGLSSNMRVSTAAPRTGGYSLRGTYPATLPKNPPLVQKGLNLPQVGELWVEYYVRIPDNFTMKDVDPTDNKKWFLVKDVDYTRDQNAVAVYFEYDVTPATAPNARLLVKYEVDETFPQYAYKTRSITNFITSAHRGKWMQFRAHVKLSSTRAGAGNTATGDGIIQVWRDGVLLYEDLKAPLKAVNSNLTSRNYLSYGYILGAANNGFSVQTTYDVDDVTIYRSNPGW